MVTTKRGYVVATFLPACAALALLISSFATTSWVESDLIESTGSAKNSSLNYGLFSGTIIRNMISERTLRLTNLARNSSKGDLSKVRFVNAGLWISTILFLILAMLASVMAAIFSVVNTTSNPIEPIAGVFGLYIWNASAVISTLLVLILWGIQFDIALSENVAYSETINGTFISSGLAVLGFSYWLLIVVVLLHAMNIVVLGSRDYFIAREPPPIIPSPSENPDGVIFLY